MTVQAQQLPRLESLDRISKIPVVESGFGYASGVYLKIKRSNSLVTWSLDTVEGRLQSVAVKSYPLLELPIGVVDSIVCKTLDEVEHRVPAINYPPEQLFNITKDLMSARIVEPVIKRADSVKQFSMNNPRLSKYGEMAVCRLDTALDRADEYVEKYLPDSADNTDGKSNFHADLCQFFSEEKQWQTILHAVFAKTSTLGIGMIRVGFHQFDEDRIADESKTKRTIQHANRLTRKLQRRLTKRTIAEARALRKTSEDIAQFLYFSLNLLVKDPREFVNKMRQIWVHLSEEEPENQIPPNNLDQLLALVARESARRFIHAVNYSVTVCGNLPDNIAVWVNTANHHAVLLLDSLIKTAHLEGIRSVILGRVEIELDRMTSQLNEVYKMIRESLPNFSSVTTSIQMKPITSNQSETNATVRHRKTPKKEKKTQNGNTQPPIQSE